MTEYDGQLFRVGAGPAHAPAFYDPNPSGGAGVAVTEPVDPELVGRYVRHVCTPALEVQLECLRQTYRERTVDATTLRLLRAQMHYLVDHIHGRRFSRARKEAAARDLLWVETLYRVVQKSEPWPIGLALSRPAATLITRSWRGLPKRPRWVKPELAPRSTPEAVLLHELITKHGCLVTELVPNGKKLRYADPYRRRSMPLHDHAGLYVPSYVLRLDLDSDDATQLWKRLKDDLDIPDTAEVFTRRGSHVYLRLPSGITFHQGTDVRPDLDVMIGSWYTVAPGSVAGDHYYRANGRSVAALDLETAKRFYEALYGRRYKTGIVATIEDYRLPALTKRRRAGRHWRLEHREATPDYRGHAGRLLPDGMVEDILVETRRGSRGLAIRRAAKAARRRDWTFGQFSSTVLASPAGAKLTNRRKHSPRTANTWLTRAWDWAQNRLLTEQYQPTAVRMAGSRTAAEVFGEPLAACSAWRYGLVKLEELEAVLRRGESYQASFNGPRGRYFFEVTLTDLPALRSYVACHADFTARFGIRHYLARSVVIQHLRDDETCKAWLAVNYVPNHKQPGHWGYRKLRAVLLKLGVLLQYPREDFSRWQANYYQLHRPPHPTYSPYRSGVLLVTMLEAMEGYVLRQPKTAEEIDRLLTKAVGTRDPIPRFADYGHSRVGADDVFEASTTQLEEVPV